MVVPCDLKNNNILVLQQQVEETSLIVVLSPVREWDLPPASRLVDVHRGEEFLLWASLFKLLFKPSKLGFLLLYLVLLIFSVEWKTIKGQQGKLAGDQSSTVPTTAFDCLFHLLKLFLTKLFLSARVA